MSNDNQKFKAGDVLVCVDTKGSSILTAGKEYTVLNSGEDLQHCHIWLVADDGYEWQLYSYGRFELTENKAHRSSLPENSEERKKLPMARGLLDYFPAALAEVARVSQKGNDQHNPGQPLHHARSKSSDHADCIVRHLIDRGMFDTDGMRHSAKVAWRALALLQEELEAEGAPLPRGAKNEADK